MLSSRKNLKPNVSILGMKLIFISVVKEMKKNLNGHIQVSQHPREEHRALAELVVAKNVTINEFETDCC